GKISVNGKPVTFGSIAFYADSRAYTGEIRSGRFSVGGVPVGSAKVTVNSIPVPTEAALSTGVDDGAKAPAMPKGPMVPVPTRFTDPAKTPLVYKVNEGTQEQDFDIK